MTRNGFLRTPGGTFSFGAVGPLPGGSWLRSVHWEVSTATGQQFRIGMSLSGADAANQANFNAGASLIDRGFVLGGFQVPLWVSHVTGFVGRTWVVPVHVRIDSGPQWLIVGMGPLAAIELFLSTTVVLELDDQTLAGGDEGSADGAL